MSDHTSKKDTPTTTEVSVNWDGLKRFLGWQGSIADLKKMRLDRPDSVAAPRRTAAGR